MCDGCGTREDITLRCPDCDTCACGACLGQRVDFAAVADGTDYCLRCYEDHDAAEGVDAAGDA